MTRPVDSLAAWGQPQPAGDWPVHLGLGEIGVVAIAAALSWTCDHHPLLLPFWGPWDFSWLAFLGTALSLLWFLRGQRAAPVAERLPGWRSVCFLVGLAAIYAMLLTHFEYLAQHMFLLNRIQHAVMHHFGPFLIALSWPGKTMGRGMPPILYRWCTGGQVRRVLRVLQQPVLAVVLFEGLLLLWLIPPVMYRAMYDWLLYDIMNASMVIDGLLFWFLVLDPRPAPAAPIGFFVRLALAFLIIFPQIAIGTALGLTQRDLYPSFTECGRVFTDIGPLLDQQIGGLVLWVPTGMMSSLAAVIILRRLFMHEDRLAQPSRLPRPEGVW
jgi:putative membrane protein